MHTVPEQYQHAWYVWNGPMKNRPIQLLKSKTSMQWFAHSSFSKNPHWMMKLVLRHLVSLLESPANMYIPNMGVKHGYCANYISIKRINAFEMKCYRNILRIPWIAHRTNSSMLNDLHLTTNWLYNFVRLAVRLLANASWPRLWLSTYTLYIYI